MDKTSSRVDQPSCAPTAAGIAAAAQASAGGNFRWTICALLFFATTINYMDRQVLGLLAPDLQKIFRWNEIQYGYIVTTFQTTYAIGLLLMGGFMDRIGTRIGYAMSIAIWSLAAMGHALANSVIGFAFARGLLGLGESGNFPAAIKTVTEWFPKKERALATGIFNSGTNVGAIIAPLTVPWVATHLGWRWAFLFTGFFSATWLLVWLLLYRRPEQHPRLSTAELQYIQSDPAEPITRIPWIRLLPHRQTWAFVLGKFMTDPIWWFYLFWLAKFFASAHGLTLTKIGPPLVVIYLAADVGSISGGWLSSSLIKRGWNVNRARKTAMLICALCVVPVVFIPHVSHLWPQVALFSLATAAHQGWSCNMFTTASDMFPRRAVGSVVGIGGFGGAVGGMCIASFTGFHLQHTHSYAFLFVIAGSAYLAALLIIQMLVPRLEPAHLRTAAE
ncbi:MAG TPA: MFS transporter [Terriglobales bacterium]|nr:MFS transporter [Terriglobales bacterium]